MLRLLLGVLLVCAADGLIRVPLSRERVRAQPVKRAVPRQTRWDNVLDKNWRTHINKPLAPSVPKVPMLNDENEAWIGSVSIGSPSQTFRVSGHQLLSFFFCFLFFVFCFFVFVFFLPIELILNFPFRSCLILAHPTFGFLPFSVLSNSIRVVLESRNTTHQRRQQRCPIHAKVCNMENNFVLLT